ncbi:hypothetical protein GE21DRAFT_1197265 [Neurospora crassa]|nr:hypothetical protein GE21DRAFT_1197265 [Neurospora crassa]
MEKRKGSLCLSGRQVRQESERRESPPSPFHLATTPQPGRRAQKLRSPIYRGRIIVCADARNGARPRHGAVLDFPYPRWACSCTGALRLCWALEPVARMQYDPRRRLWQIALATLFVHGNRARRKFM